MTKLYPKTRKAYRMKRAISGYTIPEGEEKREYHGYCEMCGEVIPEGKHKDYHHWDGVADLGMWVCYKCHKVAHGIEKGLAERYLELKAMIYKEYALKQVQKLKDKGILSKDFGEVLDE